MELSQKISKIVLQNFRSYDYLNLTIDKKMVIIAGDNASGKTNFLTAPSIFFQNYSFAKMNSMVLNNRLLSMAYNSEFSNIVSQSNTMEIGITVQSEFDNVLGFKYVDAKKLNIDEKKHSSKRCFYLNNKKLSSKKNIISEIYRGLLVMPKSNYLFLEGPTTRRKFFDGIVEAIYPHLKKSTRQLENLNRQRLIILKKHNKDHASDNVWLKTIEQQVAAIGVSIASMRLDVVNMLNSQKNQDWLQDVYQKHGNLLNKNGYINGTKIINFHLPHFTCHWKCRVMDMLKDNVPSLEIEEQYSSLLQKYRDVDAINMTTNFGVHKMDLKVVDDMGRNAENCSTGEQSTLLIAIIIAAAAMVKDYTGISPVLLLDEAFSHLDKRLGAYILDIIYALPCQSFVTMLQTQLEDRHFGKKSVQLLQVEKQNGLSKVISG